jgi:hypothetical protein
MTNTTRRRTAATIACAGLVLGATVLTTAAGATSSSAPRSGPPPGQDRGELISALPLRTWSAQIARTELTEAGFDPATVRYGVDAYRLVYRTVDAHARPTTASGLLVLPRTGTRRLRTVSFTHGSEVFRADAPSMTQDGLALGPPLTYASAGFAAVAPDLLGLGLGPGTHPWQDVRSETTASVDMLRAARSFVPRAGHTLDREVLATGFSQGATSALALARALQGGADDWFRARAVAPISGAYAWQHVELPALLSGKLHPLWSVAYTAYFTVTWNRLHHFYGSPAEVFQDPAVAGLFDGMHAGKDILPGLPQGVDKLLTERGFELLRNPTGKLAAAMQEHDAVCADWSPRMPIRLYKAGGDEQVLPENTDRCVTVLRSRGGDVTPVDVGDVDHLESDRRGTAAAVRWFTELS